MLDNRKNKIKRDTICNNEELDRIIKEMNQAGINCTLVQESKEDTVSLFEKDNCTNGNDEIFTLDEIYNFLRFTGSKNDNPAYLDKFSFDYLIKRFEEFRTSLKKEEIKRNNESIFKDGTYTYKPLPDFLEIRKSDIHGTGLFTLEALGPGISLGCSHIKVHNMSELIRTPLAGFINHDTYNPSVEMTLTEDFNNVKIYSFEILRPVQEGEELTIDYTQTPCIDNV